LVKFADRVLPLQLSFKNKAGNVNALAIAFAAVAFNTAKRKRKFPAVFNNFRTTDLWGF